MHIFQKLRRDDGPSSEVYSHTARNEGAFIQMVSVTFCNAKKDRRTNVYPEGSGGCQQQLGARREFVFASKLLGDDVDDDDDAHSLITQ